MTILADANPGANPEVVGILPAEPIVPSDIYELAEYMKDPESAALHIDEGPFLWRAASHILVVSSRSFMLEVTQNQTMCIATDLWAAPRGITETTLQTLLVPIEGCEAVPTEEILRPGTRNVLLHGLNRYTKRFTGGQYYGINDGVTDIWYLPFGAAEAQDSSDSVQ